MIRTNLEPDAKRKRQVKANMTMISDLLCHLKSIDVAESIVINKNCYFYFFENKKQKYDMTHILLLW